MEARCTVKWMVRLGVATALLLAVLFGLQAPLCAFHCLGTATPEQQANAAFELPPCHGGQEQTEGDNSDAAGCCGAPLDHYGSLAQALAHEAPQGGPVALPVRVSALAGPMIPAAALLPAAPWLRYATGPPILLQKSSLLI